MTEQESTRKIALVGTSHIGKTPILEEFAIRATSIAIVPEAARDFFKAHPEIQGDDRFKKSPQEQIQYSAFLREHHSLGENPQIILCDRSVLDAVVYVRATGDRAGSDELLERVRFWLPTYDKFLLLDPAGVPYEKDEIRQEEVEMREKFHDAFLEFFEETGIPFELLSGSLEDKIKRVDEILVSEL